MEYYILKCYQEAKNRCSDVDQGFDRFEPKIKKIVIACLVAMFTSCAEIIFTMLLLPKQLWYCIGIIILLIAMVILISVDNNDQRNHMDKYVDSHKKKIEVLDEVLQRSVQKRIAVKVKKQHRYLEINDIMYVESDKHVLNIHLKDSRVIQTTEKLSELEKTINSKRFIRCHQSYLVNMDYIKDAKTDFILSNDIRIPIRVRG